MDSFGIGDDLEIRFIALKRGMRLYCESVKRLYNPRSRKSPCSLGPAACALLGFGMFALLLSKHALILGGNPERFTKTCS